MTTPEDDEPIDIVADCVDLDNGTSAAWRIFPDRPAEPWLLVHDDDTAVLPRGCACPQCAPSEQAGPLDRLTRARLNVTLRRIDER